VSTGGFGRLGLGLRSFGAGGPLTVVRAVAVAGQVVRVVFNEEPLHRSPAGPADALNPSHYLFTVPAANATAPVPVGVDRDPIVGPVYGVGGGTEIGMDVHVDRQLVAGVTYNVRIQGIQAAAGGAIGSPDQADFGGVTQLVEVKLPSRNQDLIDLSTPPALGHYVIDDSGDIGVTTPDESTRQRVYRRQTTRKNAFRFLIDYGAGPDHKGVASPTGVASWRADMLRQIKEEPDVANAAASMTLSSTGVVIAATAVRTKRGNYVSVGARVLNTGEITPT
jgi:hypothetical protein